MSWGTLGLVNNMWYHWVPAEAPLIQRNSGTTDEKHFSTTDCLRLVSVPHIQARLSYPMSAVSVFAIILLHHSDGGRVCWSFMNLQLNYFRLFYDSFKKKIKKTCIEGTPMMCVCREGNLLSLQCSSNWHVLYLGPRVLLSLLLWFCNTMIIACHVGHISGERMIGVFSLSCALCSSPLKYILHEIIMIRSVRGDSRGMTFD